MLDSVVASSTMYYQTLAMFSVVTNEVCDVQWPRCSWEVGAVPMTYARISTPYVMVACVYAVVITSNLVASAVSTITHFNFI